MAGSPTIFISSTCRDLSAQRERIVKRLLDMGLTPIFSESKKFPVRYHLPATESCYATIEDASDIIILILGKRYGSVESNGKSVTQNEYEHAKACGIPVLVCVDKEILDIAPIVEKNPDIDLSGKVEDKQIFDFLKILLENDKKWIFPYTSIEDIEEIIVSQISTLFSECLSIYKKVMERTDEDLLKLMDPNSRRIYLRKGRFWEFDLLESLLFGYFGSIEIKFRELELEYGLGLNEIESIEDPAELQKIGLIYGKSCRTIIRYNHNWTLLLDKSLSDALGQPGEPGNASKFVFVAGKLADLYIAYLDEVIRMKQYARLTLIKDLANAYIEFVNPILNYLAQTPVNWQGHVKRIKEAEKNGETAVEIKFTLPAPCNKALNAELDKLKLQWEKLGAILNAEDIP